MKIAKWGTVVEKSGKLMLEGFQIDPEGQEIFGDLHLLEVTLDLVTERMLKAKKAIVDARQIAWLRTAPVESLPRA